MSAEKPVNPATVIGDKFRLAAVEIEDTFSAESGGHLVRVFARFSRIENDPQDMDKLCAVRLSVDNIIDMMSVIEPQKKRFRWPWSEQPPLPSLEQVEVFHDMRRNQQVPNLIRVLGAERSRYYDEILRPKNIIKPLLSPQ